MAEKVGLSLVARPGRAVARALRLVAEGEFFCDDEQPTLNPQVEQRREKICRGFVVRPPARPNTRRTDVCAVMSLDVSAFAVDLKPSFRGALAALSFAAALGLETRVARAQVQAEPPQNPAPAAGAGAHAGAGGEDQVREANNPLSTKLAVNLQDYYVSSLSELPDASSNTFLLRLSLPFWRILPRFTLPLTTVSQPGDSESGLGDFNAFVIFLFTDESSPSSLARGRCTSRRPPARMPWVRESTSSARRWSPSTSPRGP